MLSFLRTNTPRTQTAHLNPIPYEDGRSTQHFHSPSSRYMVTISSPATTHKHGRSMFNPPMHFHMYQTEEFFIVSGTARFFLDGQTQLRKKGEIMPIPVKAFHCYENASDTTANDDDEGAEDLVVSFRLDQQNWVAEERFFRNFFGYLDDVRKVGQQPSIFQIFRFLYSMEAPLAVPVMGKKSHWVSRQVSWFIMVFLGVVVGEWLLGYRVSYPEYYAEGGGKEDKDK